jgi:hypothetical protein
VHSSQSQHSRKAKQGRLQSQGCLRSDICNISQLILSSSESSHLFSKARNLRMILVFLLSIEIDKSK